MKIIGFEEHYGPVSMYRSSRTLRQAQSASSRRYRGSLLDRRTTPWRLRSPSTRTGSSDLPHYRCSTGRLRPASSSALSATWVSWALATSTGVTLTTSSSGQCLNPPKRSVCPSTCIPKFRLGRWSTPTTAVSLPKAYLRMAKTIGIDRVLFTTDYPYGSRKAARQFFDQMPINVNDKEKIAHLNAERLLGLGQNARTQKRTLASAS